MKKILVKLLEAVEVNTDALTFFLLVSYQNCSSVVDNSKD